MLCKSIRQKSIDLRDLSPLGSKLLLAYSFLPCLEESWFLLSLQVSVQLLLLRGNLIHHQSYVPCIDDVAHSIRAKLGLLWDQRSFAFVGFIFLKNYILQMHWHKGKYNPCWVYYYIFHYYHIHFFLLALKGIRINTFLGPRKHPGSRVSCVLFLSEELAFRVLCKFSAEHLFQLKISTFCKVPARTPAFTSPGVTLRGQETSGHPGRPHPSAFLIKPVVNSNGWDPLEWAI